MNKAKMESYKLGRESVITTSADPKPIKSIGNWNALYFYDDDERYDYGQTPKCLLVFFDSGATELGNGIYLDDDTNTENAFIGDQLNGRGLNTIGDAERNAFENAQGDYFIEKDGSSMKFYDLLTDYGKNDYSQYNGNYDFTTDGQKFTFIFVGGVDPNTGKVIQ